MARRAISWLLFCLSALSLAWAGYLLGPAPRAFDVGATLLLALLTALALPARRHSRTVLAHALTLLALMEAVIVARVAGKILFSWDMWPHRGYASVLALLLGIGALGLWRRKAWARWLVQGLALAGLGSAALNVAPYASLRIPFSWLLMLHISGCLLLLSMLMVPASRTLFDEPGSLWSSTDSRIAQLRWAIIASLMALPMLLVYGWLQPVVAQTATWALILAPTIAVAVVLLVRRKSIGALILMVAGASLLVLTVCTYQGAHSPAVLASVGPMAPRMALYYAAFWLPAGLLSLIVGGRLLAPMWRLTNERQ